MPLFDSICNSLSTIAAGGFSPNSQSILGYHSNLITWIIIIFMFLAGTNFALQYRFFIKRNFKAILKSEELKLYIGIFLFLSIGITTSLIILSKISILNALQDAMFQTISLITTTGFASVDFVHWPTAAKVILFLAMLTGSCAGSAGGGIKMVRILLLFKYLKRELLKI